jgi:hypothetical protein
MPFFLVLIRFLRLTGGVVPKNVYLCLKLIKKACFMKSKVIEGLIGFSGIASIEVVETASAVNPETVSNGVSIISQIVILIVTLVGLFRKNKVTKNTNN